MLPLQSPLEAYRADLTRNPNQNDFGRSDTVWLLVAHCLHRLSRADRHARRTLADNCRQAIRDLATTVEPDTPEETAMVAELARLQRALPSIDAEEGARDVVESVRVLAGHMGEAGALWLMFSALGHVRLAAPGAPARSLGMAIADQAWVARTLGDLDSADELYREVGKLGARQGIVELEARALLGRGVTARVRGNYPNARAFLRDGLAKAESAGLHDQAAVAHQGLLIAAATAGDVDTALVHGWAAFELATGEPDREAEILINLAQVSLLSGQPNAARNGFLVSMARSNALRFRLPCLGGAALASAKLGDRRRLESFATLAEESLSSSGLPFESASLLRSLFDAYAVAGDAERAEGYRLRARALARKNGFFEIVLATEQRAETSEERRKRAPRSLSEGSLNVIHSLEALEISPGASPALAAIS